MTHSPHSTSSVTRAANITRIVVGATWLAGAIFNLLGTMRMSRPYDWLTESPIPPYRWFFHNVVNAHPRRWTLLLAMYELAIGILTLGGGRRARIGLAAGSVFSAFLFSLATPYTLIMGPYAALLAWLARKNFLPALRGRHLDG